MATSPFIFKDAAPLVLTRPLLFHYTRLEVGQTIFKDFERGYRRAFPADSSWVLDIARTMIGRLSITIRFPQFYTKLSSLHMRLPHYLTDISAFPNLKELYISLGPECLPRWRATLENHTLDMTDISQQRLDAETIADSPFLSRLSLVVDGVKAVVPKICVVRWRFDKAGMPCISSYGIEREKKLTYLVHVNDIADLLWRRAVEHDQPGRFDAVEDGSEVVHERVSKSCSRATLE